MSSLGVCAIQDAASMDEFDPVNVDQILLIGISSGWEVQSFDLCFGPVGLSSSGSSGNLTDISSTFLL